MLHKKVFYVNKKKLMLHQKSIACRKKQDDTAQKIFCAKKSLNQMISFPFFIYVLKLNGKWKISNTSQYGPVKEVWMDIFRNLIQNLTQSYFFLSEERLKLVYILTNKTKLFKLTYCHLHSFVKLSDSSVRPDIERFSNGKQYQKLPRCSKSEKCNVKFQKWEMLC